MNDYLDEKYCDFPLKQNNWQVLDIIHLNERIQDFWKLFDGKECQFIRIFLDKQNIENYKRIFTLNHSGGIIIDDLKKMDKNKNNSMNHISQNFIHATVFLSIYESFFCSSDLRDGLYGCSISFC